MSENTLLQFAQVITENSMRHSPANRNEAESHPIFPTPQSLRDGDHPRRFPVRKNACIVCAICFTCSRIYGKNCVCEETQPRRGKNLPEGSLDSRAKKLHPEDKSDYEFTIAWLTESAHNMYKDENGAVVGLRNLTEVSLCKAHSSTLYRAKKRHDRSKHEAPPSPADSNGMDTAVEPPRSYVDQQSIHTYSSTALGESRLAAKAHERSFRNPYTGRAADSPPSVGTPDFNLAPSTSLKRKRTGKQASPHERMPYSSASTPLSGTGMAPLLSKLPPPSSSSSAVPPPPPPTQPHTRTDSFSSHLPPLNSTPVSSLSRSIQERLHLSGPPFPSIYPLRQPGHEPPAPSPLYSRPPIVVETVSLKSVSSSPDAPPIYHVRNLAITDTFTFRDLLSEIDMTGSPPPGKRIAISDEKNARIFPLDQAIRHVIRNPVSSHVDLCLGLADKTPIDWSAYG